MRDVAPTFWLQVREFLRGVFVAPAMIEAAEGDRAPYDADSAADLAREARDQKYLAAVR